MTPPPHRAPAPQPAPGGLATFFTMTFGISWGAWGLAYLAGADLTQSLVLTLFMLGGSGPTLAALVLRIAGRRSPRLAEGRRLLLWAPAALVLGALPAVAAAYLVPLLGTPGVGGSEVTAALAAGGGPLLFVLSTLVTGPLSEEFGWRGFAQPRLRRRFSPLATSAVLGSVWGAWHLPLFFLQGTWHESVGLASPEALLILLGAIPLSAAAWFVSERLRGGVPAAVLIHAAGNGAMALFPPVTFTAGLVFIGTLFAVGTLALVAGRGNAPRSQLREAKAPLPASV